MILLPISLANVKIFRFANKFPTIFAFKEYIKGSQKSLSYTQGLFLNIGNFNHSVAVKMLHSDHQMVTCFWDYKKSHTKLSGIYSQRTANVSDFIFNSPSSCWFISVWKKVEDNEDTLVINNQPLEIAAIGSKCSSQIRNHENQGVRAVMSVYLSWRK